MNPLALLALLGTAGTVAFTAFSQPSEPPKDSQSNGDREPDDWSEERVVQADVRAPGWYHDVMTSGGDSGACGSATPDVKGVTSYCPRQAWADVVPKPFTLRLAPPPTSSVVLRCDVECVDVGNVTGRTKVRARKSSTGRKSGSLDVNEFDNIGSVGDTCYRERLARRLDVVDGAVLLSPYLTRRPLDCEPATPMQLYTLYPAQRTTTPKGWIGKVVEWFAKVRVGSAYPLRSPVPPGPAYGSLYDLRLGCDGKGIYIAGTLAASVAAMQLRVTVRWVTRSA